MTLSLVEYLILDGQKYAIPADSSGVAAFRRFHQPVEPSQLSGLRVQSPFLDAEVQGFEDGEGLRTLDDVATGYYASLGMEPHTEVPTVGHLRLKVGRQIAQIATQAGMTGFVGMQVFKNKLYLQPKSGSTVYSWDGTTLAALPSYAAISPSGLATSFLLNTEVDELLVGLTDGRVLGWDGSAWSLGGSWDIQSAGVTFFGSAWGDAATTGISYAWYTRTTGQVRVFDWGSAMTLRFTRPGFGITAPVVASGTAYFWVYDPDNTRQQACQLFTLPGTATSGAPSPGPEIVDNYPVSAQVYRGTLYIGMAWGGSIRKVVGNVITEVLHVGATTPPATVPGADAIYAMTVYGDSLYAALVDASAPSGQRVKVYRLTGDAAGGWHCISAGGNDASTAIRSLAAFEQTLVLGDEEATDSRLYKVSTTDRLTAARLDTPDALYGTAAIQKRYRRVTLQHEALVAGQAVEPRTLLDGAAEVSLGINRDVGSTETAFDLPITARGSRLRTRWYLTNVAGSDLIVTASSVRCLPAPASVEVWEATLQLSADTYSNVLGGASDTEDVLTKFERLRTLQQTGQVFQAVDQFREGTDVKRAMLAVFDPQVPLEWRLKVGGTFDLEVPVRLLQAGQSENLVKNASFEQDGNAAAPTDWGTVIGSGTSALTDNVSAADGTYSLKVIHSGSASYGRSQSVSGLVPGRYYTISVSIRRTTWATALANPRVDVHEAGILTTGNSAGPGAAAATDAAFVRYSKTFLYPANGTGTVLVRAFADGTPANGSTVLFDAIQLEGGAPVSAFKERGAGG